MYRRKIQAIVAIIVVVSIAYSCKKNKQHDAPAEVYKPTPYALVYPDFVPSKMGLPNASPDNLLTVEGIALGKRLFFDKQLSKNGTVACASCHGQQHSFDDSTQFSAGVGGSLGTRNAMPIINLAWNKQFFWDGRRSSLETQAHDPVVNPIEMANTWPVVVSTLQQDTVYPPLFFKAFGTRTIDSNLVTKAIAQFERTLISFNSRYDRLTFLSENTYTLDEIKGFDIFLKFHCSSCHSGGLLTDNSVRNNGLDVAPADSGVARVTHNLADYGKFKVPTLRNIALTGPYMHDGRFASLNKVVQFYAASIKLGSPNLDSNMNYIASLAPMTRTEQDQLVAFLKTLTDSSFISNMDFMNH